MMSILALVYFIFYSCCSAVEILPDSNNLFISTNLISDPRGLNTVTSNNTWKLLQNRNNPLYNWGLILTLNAEEYSFRDRDGSSISISIDGFCGTSQCDGYFAFSIGDSQYFTFITDFDGYFNINAGTGNPEKTGIFIYPSCGSNSIISGNPSGLIPTSDLTQVSIRNALSGGDVTQFDQLSSTQNNENFPIKFELINNAKSNSFIFKFSSPTFTTPLECRYNSAVNIHKDFKLYISPDGGIINEILNIKKFNVNGDTCTSQS